MLAHGCYVSTLAVFSLHVGLGDVGAVDFDVDLSIFLLFLLLSLQCPSVADEVEGQQEAQHAENQQSNVDLEINTRISQCFRVCVCVLNE